jgi:hypothetical protein
LPTAEPIATDSDGAATLAVAAVPIVATAVATGDRGDGDSAVTFMGFLPIQADGYGTILAVRVPFLPARDRTGSLPKSDCGR